MRYVCIHGHFYQPWRASPWLEAIELTDSAWPYHDWNERITQECYAPNAWARQLGPDGRIARITNNYARMSFDVGPTLTAWLAAHAPAVLAGMRAGDEAWRARAGASGGAIAQAWGHAILPLCDDRDRRTQVRWGIRDFEARFGRRPQGMWLPETAADVATLETLAAEGMGFTVLAPHQAAAVRLAGEAGWTGVTATTLDTTKPYVCRLPSGRSIALFFYHGRLSQEIAFGPLLRNGDALAAHLQRTVSEAGDGPRIVHLATDGETYGHHHRFGDMALARALEVLERSPAVELTTYEAYLAAHPPADEVRIQEEPTSWSCAHGIGRWRTDCGCQGGAWRAPLRGAIDWLRDELAGLYEEAMRPLAHNPARARDAYVDTLVDPSPAGLEAYLLAHAPGLTGERVVTLRRLLEMQRHALLMQMSCGWFFGDPTGIEPVQNLRHAARALELARQATGRDLEEPFVSRLLPIESPRQGIADGRQLWERKVRPAVAGFDRMVAHAAMLAHLEPGEGPTISRAHRVHHEVAERREGVLLAASVLVSSERTGASERMAYVVLGSGPRDLVAGVKPVGEDDAWRDCLKPILHAVDRQDFLTARNLVALAFPTPLYTLRSLFRDERQRVMERLVAEPAAEAQRTIQKLHRHHAELVELLGELRLPLPAVFRVEAQQALGGEIAELLAQPAIDTEALRERFARARAERIELDLALVQRSFEEAIRTRLAGFTRTPFHVGFVESLASLAEVAAEAGLDLNLWEAQNAVYELRRAHAPAVHARAEAGDQAARAWGAGLAKLAQALRLA
jgi:alpha-amylase/alpha-mannosidase (GH57 family)